MLNLAPAAEIWLATEPADMRRGFDGLARLVVEHLERDPLAGGIFVFLNRRRDRAKLLWWDGDGLCLFYKRLERGTFEQPGVSQQADSEKRLSLSATELAMLLGGFDITSARKRKRYTHPAKPAAAH